jgi:3-methylfumaryl-CoA hydratase
MTNPDENANDWQAWVGRNETADDVATASPPRALAATLEVPLPAAGVLPPLWHWLYFLPMPRASEIGPDGHARRGGFLPPVPLPRRMWAGSRMEFQAPLRVGDALQRRSTIEAVQSKQGQSGALVFVTVRHELHVNAATAPALTEWHDIVYREAPPPALATPVVADAVSAAPAEPAAGPARAPGDWLRVLVPDEVLLFRYSALTFNGHRIHYDRRYAMQQEGYPGLVVHGPLIATLLMELLRAHLQPGEQVQAFRFKAQRASFDGQPLHLHGRRESSAQVHLWAGDAAGRLAMDAHALLRH